VSRGLLDTSVVIAVGAGEEIALPEQCAISTITLCELHHGVLVAEEERRPGRLALLTAAERTFEALPVDARIAPHYGRLIATARAAAGRRPHVADALIAATAMSHGMPLYARDRDFERLDLPALVRV
jgi:predicted nucleic acid-binding protein